MMNVKLVNKGTAGELYLIGRLNSNNAAEVEKLIFDAADRFESIILNFSALEYTSSAGLRILLKLKVSMDKKGGDLRIKDVNPAVMEVFELTGLAGVLDFI